MERLFSPCTRLHDILESPGERLERFRRSPGGLQELNLDVSTEAFFSAAERAFTFSDLHALLGNENMVVWLTPHAVVMPERGRGIFPWILLGGSCSISFKADGKVIVALASSPEHLLEICDVVLRLLVASVVQSVHLHNWERHDIALINAASLTYLMEQCQSLKLLVLKDLEMDENQIRVLGDYSRPDLEIELDSCKFTSAETGALVDILRHNQGLTRLEWCYIDYSVLADGLRGNSRLRSLKARSSVDYENSKRQLLAIAGALKENKGLVDLNLSSVCWASDETWAAICDSLKEHPTLEVLTLRVIDSGASVTPASMTSRIQSLLDMIKVNMSIHTIHLDRRYSQHVLFREPVIPFLKTNRFRPRLIAIQKTRPIVYRAKVLGRALLSARTDANSFWMLLSGNPEVALPSATATTTPAVTSLPTPASAAVTTRAASTANASATANVVTPIARQKRKARP
jgi:hypothetical protein